MMLRVMVGVTLVALTTACAVKPTSEPTGKPAESQTTATTQSKETAKTAKAAPKDGSKIRCEEEPVTNSRLRKNRVCMTEAAWAEQSERARSSLNETRNPGTGVTLDPKLPSTTGN